MTLKSRTGAFVLASLIVLCAGVPPAASAAPRHHPQSLIVKFRGKQAFHRTALGRVRSGSPSLDAALDRAGVTEVRPLFPAAGADLALRERLGMDRFFVLRLDRPGRVPDVVSELSRRPEIDRAEPDFEGEGAGMTEAPAAASPAGPATGSAVIPSDTYFGRQWAYLNSGTNVYGYPYPGRQGADIKATEAWAITTGSPDVIVAVLDSGIKFDHPDFAGRIWTNEGEIPGNSLDDDGNGFIDDVRGWNFAYNNNDVSDDIGHGTNVSSIIGATANNGLGYAGLDWNCRIMMLKVLNANNFGFYTWWAEGIFYAVNRGVRVISMSLGGDGASTALQSAVQYAHARGVLVVASMGNRNSTQLSYPAAYDNDVVAVGATDARDERASFSSFGNHIDVVAPGVQIYGLWHLDDNNYDAAWNGTSMSAPMVSALASLLFGQDPSRTADQVANIVRGTADDQVGRTTEDTPGIDIYHGYGRINAYRAVTGQGSTEPPTIAAPALVTGAEGAPLVIDISVSDADSNPIRSLTADLSMLPIGNNATFQTSPDFSQGTLTWTPDYLSAALYQVRFAATDPLRSVATTDIDVTEANDPPALSAPDLVSAIEGLPFLVAVSASDADGDPLVGLEAEGLPAGATFTVAPTIDAGTLAWTPGFTQAGNYTVTFTARSAFGTPLIVLGTSVITYLSVLDFDQAPLVSAPSRVEAAELEAVHVDVAVSDPDGDVLTELRAESMPRGMTFAAGPNFASGSLDWLPDATQAGVYRATVTAVALHPAPGSGAPGYGGGSGSIDFIIRDQPDRAPVVTAPVEAAGAEGSALSVDVSASDPDGDAILDLAAAPLPPGASFTTGPLNAGGALTWTPDYDQAGTYSVTISAQSAPRPSGVSAPVPLTGTATISIAVANTDRAPFVSAPEGVNGPEGVPLTFSATAADPDGDAIAGFAATGLPLGATFVVDPAGPSGSFAWTPSFVDAGAYPVTITATNALSGSAVTVVSVQDANRPPVAVPGGPYSGLAGRPIAFDGSASFDPDGAPLSHRWDFGDGSTATGSAPVHTYADGGAFVVGLTVSDGALEASATTSATVQAVLAARAFATGGDRTIRLGAGKPTACVRIEPVGGGYSNTQVDLSSLVMISSGTGAVDRIGALVGKTSVASDADRNGVEELAACFAKEDLRRLFSLLPPGHNPVTVRLEGNLLTGGALSANLSIEVVAGGADLAASVTPNPSRGGAVLTYRIARPGRVSVRLFDLAGRLVRVLARGDEVAAGYHDVRLEPAGAGLAAGVYYYRVDTPEGSTSGRLAVLR